MMTEQDQMAGERSIQAEKIMSDPLVLEALALIDQQIFTLWAETGLTRDHREELYRMHQTLGRFVAAFEGYIQNGAAWRMELGIDPPKQSLMDRIKEYFK